MINKTATHCWNVTGRGSKREQSRLYIQKKTSQEEANVIQIL